MSPVATGAPEAFLLVLASTPPGGSGTMKWISSPPGTFVLVYGSSSGALVATGVTCAPGVKGVHVKKPPNDQSIISISSVNFTKKNHLISCKARMNDTALAA